VELAVAATLNRRIGHESPAVEFAVMGVRLCGWTGVAEAVDPVAILWRAVDPGVYGVGLFALTLCWAQEADARSIQGRREEA
jgi:hypothetical protein